VFWSLLLGFVILGGLVWAAAKFVSSSKSSPGTPAAAAGSASAVSGGKSAAPPAASADTKTKMLAAEQYSDRKEYNMAEDLYKQIVAAEPDNVEALKGLASVLYREDKVDESAAILDRIPKN
jgi:tetratricopeptide (TPR) repeat protein